MKDSVFNRFLTFLGELDEQGVSYSLAHNREESIMVSAAVPGERWEIEFLDDGSVEVERFISNGEILGPESLNELFARYSELCEDPEESTSIPVLSESERQIRLAELLATLQARAQVESSATGTSESE